MRVAQRNGRLAVLRRTSFGRACEQLRVHALESGTTLEHMKLLSRAPRASPSELGSQLRALQRAEAAHARAHRAARWNEQAGLLVHTASTLPPTAVATTGLPAAIASTSEFGKALAQRRQALRCRSRDEGSCALAVRPRNGRHASHQARSLVLPASAASLRRR